MYRTFCVFLLSFFASGQEVEVKPMYATRRLGDKITILSKVTYPINSCRVRLGTVVYRLIPEISSDDVSYAGNGLQNGECGVYIPQVKDEWSGNVTFFLGSRHFYDPNEIMASMKLIVARAPRLRKVVWSTKRDSFVLGDVITATCVVLGGRPAAKVSWYLGDMLLEDTHQPVVKTDSQGEIIKVSQNFTRVLNMEDNLRQLCCRVTHEAFDGPRSIFRLLTVRYSPRYIGLSSNTIALQLGSEGRLNIAVRANPAPTAEWIIGDTRLKASQSAGEGNVTALNPIKLGNGYYNIVLVLHRVTKEDEDQIYVLRVSNELGDEYVPLRITTFEEIPAKADNKKYTSIYVGAAATLLGLLGFIFCWKHKVIHRFTQCHSNVNSPRSEQPSHATAPPLRKQSSEVEYEAVNYDECQIETNLNSESFKPIKSPAPPPIYQIPSKNMEPVEFRSKGPSARRPAYTDSELMRLDDDGYQIVT